LAEPHKHDLKKSINIWIQNFLKANRQLFPKVEAREHPERPKPVLIVFGELFQKGHAMQRSWAKRLENFRERFHVVFITHAETGLDESIKNVCDETYLFNPRHIDDLLAYIGKIEPDIMLYPSIGMSITSIFLSNQRLAPLQLMAMGHPATTHSAHIDAV